MTCDRCHKPIKPGDDYDTMAPDSGSGVAPTVYLHKRACKPVPRQTAPVSPIRRRR